MERGGTGDKKKEEFLGKSREGDGKEREAKEDKRKRKDGGRRSKKINLGYSGVKDDLLERCRIEKGQRFLGIY